MRVSSSGPERNSVTPEEIIVAVIGVETMYGAQTGKHRVLDALTTLAFDYPKRASFFRDELEHYLLLGRERSAELADLLSIKGSYAGAIGIPQFMPSSYRHYAVDFDNDGKINLSGSMADAIGSVANYLKSYGWEARQVIALPALVNGENYRVALFAGQKPGYSADEMRKLGIVTRANFPAGGYATLLSLKTPMVMSTGWASITSMSLRVTTAACITQCRYCS